MTLRSNRKNVRGFDAPDIFLLVQKILNNIAEMYGIKREFIAVICKLFDSVLVRGNVLETVLVIIADAVYGVLFPFHNFSLRDELVHIYSPY